MAGFQIEVNRGKKEVKRSKIELQTGLKLRYYSYKIQL